MKKWKLDKKYLTVYWLTLSSLCYYLPYISNTFYEQFQKAYSLTNSQIGGLMAMFALTATPGYLFGGFLADRFSPKKLIVISNFLTAGIGFVVAFSHTYAILRICYLGFGVSTTFLHWAACVKMVRAQGKVEEQGRLFGFYTTAIALNGAVSSYVILAFLKKIVATTGFGVVMAIYGGIILIAGILVLLFVKDIDSTKEENGFSFKLVGETLKHPGTWLNAFIVMGLFIIISGTTYLNPYLTQVYAVTTTLAVGISIFNKTIARVIFSPIGGTMLDKLGGSPKILIPGCGLIIAMCLGMIFMPQAMGYSTLAVTLVILFIVVMSGMRAGLYTPVAEAQVPLKITGTSLGIISAIGYSTDLWLYKLCGGWIDRYGNAGYKNIFGLYIVGMVLVITCSILLKRYMDKINKNRTSNLANES